MKQGLFKRKVQVREGKRMQKDQRKHFELNGYYSRPECRDIVYRLYKGKCQGRCQREIALHESDVGHIIPQTKPELLASIFPGIDIHNLINLQLLCQKCNRSVSNVIIEDPLFLNNALGYSMRVVEARLHKVVSKKPAVFGDTDLRKLLEGETEELFTVTFDESFPGRVVHQGFARYDVTDIFEQYETKSRNLPIFDGSVSLRIFLTSIIATSYMLSECSLNQREKIQAFHSYEIFHHRGEKTSFLSLNILLQMQKKKYWEENSIVEGSFQTAPTRKFLFIPYEFPLLIPFIYLTGFGHAGCMFYNLLEKFRSISLQPSVKGFINGDFGRLLDAFYFLLAEFPGKVPNINARVGRSKNHQEIYGDCVENGPEGIEKRSAVKASKFLDRLLLNSFKHKEFLSFCGYSGLYFDRVCAPISSLERLLLFRQTRLSE